MQKKSNQLSKKFKHSVCEYVSSCSLCQAENERFSRSCLSESENLSNRTNLKTNFKNLSNGLALSSYETLSNRLNPKV
jgi:hypothetical protein